MVTIMRRTPAYVLSDVDDVKRLVRENPWGTLISAPTAGLIEVLLIIQGPHGYISPAWYPRDQIIPTWNHATVGIRLRLTRFDAQLKLSQDKAPEVVNRVIDELEHGQHYPNPALAREMRRVRH